ncbi:hypothetical protein [Enterococcus massiliensis]|uniref:hypothetical protein n=1 Tax=Enterococcus massiliensis TaxID=1640685 RepID=UPI00065DE617|nr:hypothetical protein [Enterococcus massiliensis]
MDKEEMKRKINMNKWFTFKEVEKELKKHWRPENDINGDYLEIGRRQLQTILRSDIIGSYYGIHTDKKDYSEEEWLFRELYGWEQKIIPSLLTLDKATDSYVYITEEEVVHVFPKYDNLFPEGEESIVLSIWDEQLEDMDKLNMRDLYEGIHKTENKGKTPYIMTEPYLFALKHEIERRKYPSKNIYLDIHSPSDMVARLDGEIDDNLKIQIVDELIDEFDYKVNELVARHIAARNVERQRFNQIEGFINEWGKIYRNEFDEILRLLKNEGLCEDFRSMLSILNIDISYKQDIKRIRNKIKNKLKSEDELPPSAKIARIIYSSEIYNRTKVETFIMEDNKLLVQSGQIRHKFGEALKKYIQSEIKDHYLVMDGLRCARVK